MFGPPNHPHTVVITQADVLAGVDKMYTITGSGHTHSLTITAADFAKLRAGTQAIETSGVGGAAPGHTHVVTVMCG
jgi:hypothetical protein